MKYLVFDETKKSDTFVTEFETKEEAIAFADDDWKRMSNNDKEGRRAFYVLESVNPDEDAENHFDGECVKIYKSDKGEITLPCGDIIKAEQARALMDDEICDQMESEETYIAEQDWFDDYCARHSLKHDEVFELAKQNPVW